MLEERRGRKCGGKKILLAIFVLFIIIRSNFRKYCLLADREVPGK
jgi:hypothetical protein